MTINATAIPNFATRSIPRERARHRGEMGVEVITKVRRVIPQITVKVRPGQGLVAVAKPCWGGALEIDVLEATRPEDLRDVFLAHIGFDAFRERWVDSKRYFVANHALPRARCRDNHRG